MAERKRAVLVALQARNNDDTPCDTGHIVAHKIAQAGEELPSAVEPWNAEYSVFGERRLLLEVPTFLESRESPFTREGRKRLHRLQWVTKILRIRHKPGDLENTLARVIRNQELEEEIEQLQDKNRVLQAQIDDLEETLDAVSMQLKGKLR